jgi:hypothetical protein
MWSSASVAFEFLFGQYVIKRQLVQAASRVQPAGWPALAR